MKRTPLLIVPLLLLALSGCGSEPKVPPAPTVTTTENEVRVTGTGAIRSPSFRIGSSGTFKAYFKASKTKDGPNDPAGCPVTAEIVSGQADMGYLKHLSTDAQPSTDMPGMLETHPFHLEVQKYAVNMDTPCEWQVVLQRQLAR
jgi:hypothetical protein